ncbi:MAG: LysR family transcriptional regulator [Sphingobium sp.]
MELKRLRYFLRIASDGSLTKAAGVLGIAQPALSRQMRLLEEELGVSLFTRTARGMRLTDEGEYLRAAAAGPLRELEMAFQNIRTFPAPAQAQFAIGIASNLSDLLAAPLALHLRSLFPSVRFKLVDGITGSLTDWLKRGIVDFVLVEEAVRSEQFRERVLTSLPLVLGGPPDSPLPPEQHIRFADAAGLPLVQTSHHIGIRGVLDDCAGRMGMKLNILFEADNARLIRSLLEAGTGYSILPQCYFLPAIQNGTLRIWPITDPVPEITLALASRTNSQLSARLAHEIEDALATFVEEYLKALPPSGD